MMENADKHDSLWMRLEESYQRQRIEYNQREHAKREATLGENYKNGNESLQEEQQLCLMSHDLQIALHALEKLCAKHKLRDGVLLAQKIQAQVNRELRQALSALETHYASILSNTNTHTLKKEDANYNNKLDECHVMTYNKETYTSKNLKQEERERNNGSSSKIINVTNNHDVSFVHSDSSPQSLPQPVNTNINLKQLQQCPSSWSTTDKIALVSELQYQQRTMSNSANEMSHLKQMPSKKGYKWEADELLMGALLLVTESLATLLMCEVVRVYLYDHAHNLHCVVSYPPRALQADPMLATYTEMMLAKEVHETVCERNIAVNGSTTPSNFVGERDAHLMKTEMEQSGLASMRNCLIFPINNMESSDCKAFGMIHAVNKINVSDIHVSEFTSNDEMVMFSCARILSKMISRHHNTAHYFSMSNNSHVLRALYSVATLNKLDDHLPERIVDNVLSEAASLGNAALAAPSNMLIYRASVHDVYETRTLRRCKKKMSFLLLDNKALTSVEYNLKALNDAWLTAMEDNVTMHQQYREQGEQLYKLRQLLRNLLDGLTATRSMREADEMAVYLQKLELLGRSENVERIASFIAHTLVDHKERERDEERQERLERLVKMEHSQSNTNDAKLITNDNINGSIKNTNRNCTISNKTNKKCNCNELLQHAIHPSQSNFINNDKNNILLSDTKEKNNLLEPEQTTNSPFLTETEISDLAYHVKSLNRVNAAAIHMNGPEGIRTYSIDEAKKRKQIEYIKNLSASSEANDSALTYQCLGQQQRQYHSKQYLPGNAEKYYRDNQLRQPICDTSHQNSNKKNNSIAKATINKSCVPATLLCYRQHRPFKLQPPSERY